MPTTEYKPNFKMWLFSIFLAAGFGSAGADGVSYLVKQYFKKDGQLLFVDKGCWNREVKDKKIPTCEFIFKNIGDKPIIVTDLKIGNELFRSFYTNNPGGLSKASYNFTNANISITEAGGLLVISKMGIKKADWGKKACLLYMKSTLSCS